MSRGKEGGAGVEEKFLSQFGRPPRLLSCECERTSESTLGRTFQLISGPIVQALLSRDDNRLAKLVTSSDDNAVVDELFWTTLSRAPSDTESNRMVEYLKTSSNRRQALEDIAWSLINAKEFLLRQ
jgi:hypothetical protein